MIFKHNGHKGTEVLISSFVYLVSAYPTVLFRRIVLKGINV
jgi:cytochrome b involved in lipid metabolism